MLMMHWSRMALTTDSGFMKWGLVSLRCALDVTKYSLPSPSWFVRGFFSVDSHQLRAVFYMMAALLSFLSFFPCFSLLNSVKKLSRNVMAEIDLKKCNHATSPPFVNPLIYSSYEALHFSIFCFLDGRWERLWTPWRLYSTSTISVWGSCIAGKVNKMLYLDEKICERLHCFMHWPTGGSAEQLGRHVRKQCCNRYLLLFLFSSLR